ncbi:MAG: hypothetical protein JNK49_11025 [Planctomycetes bacterium]|nr:hypothetical protein [Planctomycetota bacterium]
MLLASPSALLAAVALLLPVLAAQAPTAPPKVPSQAERIALRDAKRKLPAFARWQASFDFDAAKRQAAKDDRAILAYFTVSLTPNPACDAAESGLLATSEFAQVAADFVPFVHITSGVEGEPYPNLMHRTVGAIAPTLAFLETDGTVLATVRPLELAVLRDLATKVQALFAARRMQASTTDPKARDRALFLAEFDLARIPPANLASRAATAGLTAEQLQLLDPKLVDAELAVISAASRLENRTQQAAQVAALHAAGRRPTEARATLFWGFVLVHAAATKNGTLADQAYAELLQRESKTKDLRSVLASREQWQKLVAEAKQP